MSFSAGEAQHAMQGFPVMQPDAFVRHRLVVVAPHPDDESLGCGGLIAACRARDVPVGIIVVSNGAGSHLNSRAFPPDRLATLRRDEVLAAAGEVGVGRDDVHFLELPDRRVPEQGVMAERAITAMVHITADADVMTVTWRHDPHVDHRASFALARSAAAQLPDVRLWEYPIWGLTLPPDTELAGVQPSGVRLDIGEFREAKARAIAAHRSQTTGLITDDPTGFRLDEPVLALFAGRYEIFLEAHP